jgi:hypothetical protein
MIEMTVINQIMKLLAISLLLFTQFISCFSQKVYHDIFASAGKQTEMSGINISYTIGQTFAGFSATDDVLINQGFNQTFIWMFRSNSSGTSAKLSVSAFPNPTRDYINVALKNIKNGKDIKVRLTDYFGRIIATGIDKSENSDELKFTINMTNEKSGMYHILIYDSKSLLASVNVVKQ